jgi:hypothetical protein
MFHRGWCLKQPLLFSGFVQSTHCESCEQGCSLSNSSRKCRVNSSCNSVLFLLLMGGEGANYM